MSTVHDIGFGGHATAAITKCCMASEMTTEM